MGGRQRWVVRGTFGELTLHLGGTPIVAGDASNTRSDPALSEFLFDLRNRAPEAVRVALEIERALAGVGAPTRRELPTPARSRRLERVLEQAALTGSMQVASTQKRPALAFRSKLADVAPLGPDTARDEDALDSFVVRFADETDQGIDGLDVAFSFQGRTKQVTTDGSGIARLDDVSASFASVSVVSMADLEDLLEARWEKARKPKVSADKNVEAFSFSRDLSSFALESGEKKTIILKPPLGKLFAELWDKSGRVRHALRKYTISGPVNLEGVTDEQGRLSHADVPQGDYALDLALDFFEGDPDAVVEAAQTQLVALDGGLSAPQVRMIAAVPRSTLVRLNMFFNTNKAFLLPTALPAVEKLRELYAENTPSQLLVVGHADTKGGSAYNDKLSLERAQATIAYLKDDVDAWLAFYGSGIDAPRRWGKVEDHLMITAMPDFVTKTKGEAPVHWYQRTRGLTVDGDAGTKTRTKLVGEYMALDGASLADLHGEIVATAHGCGENFPLDDGGEDLDAEAQDEKRDPIDRRVELFFFDPEFGISPPPPGKNSGPASTQYPKWRERLAAEVELEAGDPDAPRVIFAELADAHFRTDSAVVLPEGENPDGASHEAFTSVGIMAAVLRFNDEHAGRTMLVAGHTDTAADVKLNQTLSEQRAAVALSLLKGDRAEFARLCNARHTVADIKQILSWVSGAFTGLIFPCNPGTIDDNAATAVGPISKFQTAFNANKTSLGSSATNLKVDGSAGELTWGAFFDCYEFGLRQELGETAAGVSALRDKIQFTDPDHPSLGFSEHFPIEELGVDNFRSQTNRRVELVFFEPGEEPDLAHAASDPETSDLYLPGRYEREPLPETSSAQRVILSFKLVDHLGFAFENTPVTLHLPDEDRVVTTDANGQLTAKVPPGLTSVELPDGRFVHFGGGYANYKHDPVNELQNMPDDPQGAFIGSDSLDMTLDDMNSCMASLPMDDVAPLP